jgi:hypothetical protein
MTGLLRPRAYRYGVSWPVRIRTPASGQWSIGTSVNLSISGVLVEARRQWRIGEVLELELDFPSPGATPQTVGAIGHVSRTDGQTLDRAAIQFDLTGAAQVSRASAQRHVPSCTNLTP